MISVLGMGLLPITSASAGLAVRGAIKAAFGLRADFFFAFLGAAFFFGAAFLAAFFLAGDFFAAFFGADFLAAFFTFFAIFLEFRG